MDSAWIPLCNSRELVNGGLAIPFDIVYAGQTCRGFAVRYEGVPYAFLNRCTHLSMELDYQPNQVFDSSGQWLICATHGALYSPTTGECVAGPCRGKLIKIALRDHLGVTEWQTTYKLKPVQF